jgi:hypothetical protein
MFAAIAKPQTEQISPQKKGLAAYVARLFIFFIKKDINGFLGQAK